MNKEHIELTHEDKRILWKTGSKILLALCLLAVLPLYGCPKYNVWKQSLVGEAELRRAEHNRQIAIEEAKAKKQAANELSEAEIIRARGVAEANRIIGESLKGNEGYLRYLWIQGLQEGATPQVVYVPTEAGLPILEAGRISNPSFGSASTNSK